MWGAAIMGQGLPSQHQAAFSARERHQEALARLLNSRGTTEAGPRRIGQIGGVPAASQAEREVGQPGGRAPQGIDTDMAPSGPLEGGLQGAGGADGRPVGASSDRPFPSSITAARGTEAGVIAGGSRRAGLRAPRLRAASGPQTVGPDHLDAYVGRQAGISNILRGEGNEYVCVLLSHSTLWGRSRVKSLNVLASNLMLMAVCSRVEYRSM